MLIILQFNWNSPTQTFFYTKSNFITHTSAGNIPSAHPSFYQDKKEHGFECDNGYTIVSRKYRGKDVFNFKDCEGRIISEIDFTQVLPFSQYKGMTARGYTPDRRCYMVFENGNLEEVNENKRYRIDSLINEIVQRCMSKITNR